MTRIQSISRHPQRLAAAGVLLCSLALVVACKAQQATVAPTTDSEASTAGEEVKDSAGSCPAQNFEGFLKAYASDEQVRRRFTAPVVKVARISDEGDAGYRKVIESVPATEYTEFLLAFRDGKYTFAGLSQAEEAGSPGLSPIITAEPNDTYFVTLPDDVEGISYRFERHDGCWRLTEDPDATP